MRITEVFLIKNCRIPSRIAVEIVHPRSERTFLGRAARALGPFQPGLGRTFASRRRPGKPCPVLPRPRGCTGGRGDAPEDRHFHVVAELLRRRNVWKILRAFVVKHGYRAQFSGQYVGQGLIHRRQGGLDVPIIDGIHRRFGRRFWREIHPASRSRARVPAR